MEMYIAFRNTNALRRIGRNRDKSGPVRTPHPSHKLARNSMDLPAKSLLESVFVRLNQAVYNVLHANAIGNVAAGRFGRADNLDDCAPAHAVVPRHRIVRLNAGQLGLLEAVAFEQFGLFGGREDLVFGHQLNAVNE
jgi:hypothetical protein